MQKLFDISGFYQYKLWNSFLIQALELQGKRSEALKELSKICRIYQIFPPEEHSVSGRVRSTDFTAYFCASSFLCSLTASLHTGTSLVLCMLVDVFIAYFRFCWFWELFSRFSFFNCSSSGSGMFAVLMLF